MRVHDHRYRVSRGMFEPVGLREFEVTSASDDSVVIANDPALNPGERHDRYATAIAEDTGLENFAQLVFLQLFVVTFDERRDLLFWGERTLPAALYIAFGLDPAKATRQLVPCPLLSNYPSAAIRGETAPVPTPSTRRR